MKAIDVGKPAATDAGKKLVEKADMKLLTPKSQEITSKFANVAVRPEEVTKKINKALAKNIDEGAINLSKLIDGSSLNCSTASTAIAIQDLVKRLSGPDLKVI